MEMVWFQIRYSANKVDFDVSYEFMINDYGA